MIHFITTKEEKMRKCLIGLIVAIFMLVSGLAGAQTIPDTSHKVGVGFRVNGILPSEDTFFDHELDTKNQVMLGASVSYGVNEWLTLEAAFDYSLDIDLKDETDNVKIGKINVYPLTFSAQLRYLTKNPQYYTWMVPYITLGFGYYFVDGDVAGEYKKHWGNEVNLDFDGAWGGHVGLGIDFFASERLAVGFEARYFWASGDVERTVDTPVGPAKKEVDYDLNSWMIGANIKYYFDFGK